MSEWVGQARVFSGGDPAYQYICAWIAFNCYYASVTMANIRWISSSYSKHVTINRHARTHIPEWVQLDFLKKKSPFGRMVEEVKNRNSTLFKETRLEIPVQNLLTQEWIPSESSRDTPIMEMGHEDLLDVLYVIRNNLFHGGKERRMGSRDMNLCRQAATFLVPFDEFALGELRTANTF